MATKSKKDTVTDLLANIFPNATKQITALRNRVPISDLINSVAFNVTIAQLHAEDDSAEHSLAYIIDSGKQGLFYYDSNDVSSPHDGVVVIVTATNRRYRRFISGKFDARWTGILTPYFTTLAAANAAITPMTRFIGLTVDIMLAGGTLTSYWYRDGVGDVNLVQKGSDIKVYDQVVGDGSTYVPGDNTNTMTNPGLAGVSVVLFAYANGILSVATFPTTFSITDTYVQYNPATGAFVLFNGVYSTLGRILIIYK